MLNTLTLKQRLVYEAVQRLGPAASPQQVVDETGINASTVRTYMRRLESDGLIERDAHGHYSIPEKGAGSPAIAQELKALRERAGTGRRKITQQDVAAAVDISVSAYQKYEQGQSEPSASTMDAIRRFFQGQIRENEVEAEQASRRRDLLQGRPDVDYFPEEDPAELPDPSLFDARRVEIARQYEGLVLVLTLHGQPLVELHVDRAEPVAGRASVEVDLHVEQPAARRRGVGEEV